MSQLRFRLLALFLPIMPIASSAASSAVSGSDTASFHNIEFARVSGAPLYLDAQLPRGTGPFPAVIIVHGGGWVRGDRRIDVAPLFKPLTEAGIAWFSIDYRLSGDITQFGAAIQDVKTAILFVRDHAAEYHVDADRIALVGESAGGQLAAMAALRPDSGTRVKAVVAMYTPVDLAELARSSSFIPSQIRDTFRGTPLEQFMLARLRHLSPIENVGPDAPPFLLIHGTEDRLVPFSQSRAMCDRLTDAGASCRLVPVDGAGHGLRWWESSFPTEAAAYKRELVRWLGQQLGSR